MEGIADLVALTRSADPEVRGRAATALGTIAGEESFSALVRLLGDGDDRVRMAAVRSLGELRNPAAVEPLLPLFEEDSTELTCTVLASLAQIADPRTFAPIVARLFDVDDEIRKNAAAAAGCLRDARALEPLLMCLEDASAPVRANSAWALGQLGSWQAVKPLQKLADSMDAGDVRANAVSSLGTLALRSDDAAQASEVLSFLLDVLDDQAEAPKVRMSALLTFAQQFDRACQVDAAVAAQAFADTQVLAQQCADDDLRSAAVWALGKICRREQVSSLGISEQIVDEVFDVLVHALDDPYEWCVRYAIEALSDVGQQRCIQAIQEFSQQPDHSAFAALCSRAAEAAGRP